MSVLTDFLSKQNDELKRKAQEQVNQASSELSNNSPITLAGNYLCEVATFAYRDKKKDNAIRVFPEMYVSTNKGSLNLSISLKVVDGTPQVPKGSSIYKNITLCPGSMNGQNPSDETIGKVMRFTKPVLVALTGNDKIEMTDAWMEEWLLPKYEEKGDKLVLVKDHKMKNKVICLVDQQLGADQVLRLVVKNVVKAKPGDKSETFLPNPSRVIAPVATTPAPSYEGLVETGEEDIPPHIPEVEEFN